MPPTRTPKHQQLCYFPIEKFERQDDGTLIVKGIASTETTDSDGETITADCMRKALPDYMVYGAVREMHGKVAAGTALAAHVDDDNVTHLEALVVDPVSVKKVETGVLKGFSVFGPVTKRNALNKKIIEGMKLIEISLVDRPANPDARISVAKFDGEGRLLEEGDAIRKVATNDPPAPARKRTMSATARKGLYDVGRLATLIQDLQWLIECAASEAAYEGDDSSVPGQLKEMCSGLCGVLKTMVDEETAELLGLIGDATGGELVAAAAKAIAALGPDVLHKKGAKFSKATVGALATVHKMLDDGASMMASLKYTDTANQEDSDMTDAEKAALTSEIAGSVTTAVLAAIKDEATKSAKAETEQQTLGRAEKAEALVAEQAKTLETMKASLDASNVKLETLSKAVQASGAIRLVAKSGDVATGATADEAAKADAALTPDQRRAKALRHSFANPEPAGRRAFVGTR